MSQAGIAKIFSGILPGNVLTKVNVQTGTSPVVPAAQTITFNGATVAAGTNPVRTDGTGPNTMALEVQTSQAIAATDATKIGLSAFNSAHFTVDANGFVSVVASDNYISLSPYIVGPDTHSGFATIGAAITQAVADGASATNPKNIYIKPQSGGYTENLTLSDGINLVGFGGSWFNGINTTKITGKMTMTATGTASVNGLSLQTNSDYVVEITGANAATVNITNCMISATNSNAFHCTNANGSINFFQCQGLITGANAYFVTTGGTVNAYYCIFSGANSTSSTFANGNFTAEYTTFDQPITTSGTSALSLVCCEILPASNTTAVTHGGSGNSYCSNTRFVGGTASAVSIAGTLPMINCVINSSNTNAITGAGTLQYAFITFTGSSSTVNTATQTALATLI